MSNVNKYGDIHSGHKLKIKYLISNSLKKYSFMEGKFRHKSKYGWILAKLFPVFHVNAKLPYRRCNERRRSTLKNT